MRTKLYNDFLVVRWLNYDNNNFTLMEMVEHELTSNNNLRSFEFINLYNPSRILSKNSHIKYGLILNTYINYENIVITENVATDRFSSKMNNNIKQLSSDLFDLFKPVARIYPNSIILNKQMNEINTILNYKCNSNIEVIINKPRFLSLLESSKINLDFR